MKLSQAPVPDSASNSVSQPFSWSLFPVLATVESCETAAGLNRFCVVTSASSMQSLVRYLVRSRQLLPSWSPVRMYLATT